MERSQISRSQNDFYLQQQLIFEANERVTCMALDMHLLAQFIQRKLYRKFDLNHFEMSQQRIIEN